jgi:hypothetical protein
MVCFGAVAHRAHESNDWHTAPLGASRYLGRHLAAGRKLIDASFCGQDKVRARQKAVELHKSRGDVESWNELGAEKRVHAGTQSPRRPASRHARDVNA